MADENVLKEFANFWRFPKDEEGKGVLNSYIYRSVAEVERYVKKKYKDKDIPDTLKILSDYYANFEKTDSTVVSLSDLYLLKSIKEVRSSLNLVFDIYKSPEIGKDFWENPNAFPYTYTASKSDNYKILAHDIFHNFDSYKDKPFTKEELINLGGEEEKKVKARLEADLEMIFKSQAKRMIKTYVNSIKDSVSTLDKLGVLSELIKKNNMDRIVMDFDLLTFNFNESKDTYKYSVSQLMDEEFLIKLPFEKLVLLHSFYSNRLKKVADTFGLGLFICTKQANFETITKDLNREKAIEEFLQYNTMDNVFEIAKDKIYKNIGNYAEKSGYKGNRYVAVSFNRVYDDFLSKYAIPYEIYSKEDSNLKKDFEIYFYTRVTDYMQKDFSMETLLLIASEKFDKINWGYIPEYQTGLNSIKRGKNNILLAMDLDGFNMPVRLHMPLDIVRNFFEKSNKKPELPNYIGSEDLIERGKHMGASILMPLSPKHRKKVISYGKTLASSKPYYNFKKHIQSMQYENNLIRLNRWKDPNGRSSGKVCTNLLTGEERTIEHER